MSTFYAFAFIAGFIFSYGVGYLFGYIRGVRDYRGIILKLGQEHIFNEER